MARYVSVEQATINGLELVELVDHPQAHRALSHAAVHLGLDFEALTESDCDRLLREVAGRRDTTLGHVAWYARAQVPHLFTAESLSSASEPVRSRTTRDRIVTPEGQLSYVALVGMLAESVQLSEASRVVRLAAYKVGVQDRALFQEDEVVAIIDAIESMGGRWQAEAQFVRARIHRRPTPLP